jgi:hypothetical protein
MLFVLCFRGSFAANFGPVRQASSRQTGVQIRTFFANINRCATTTKSGAYTAFTDVEFDTGSNLDSFVEAHFDVHPLLCFNNMRSQEKSKTKD